MDLWFTENHTANIRFSIKIEEHLFHGKSEHQMIDVFQSAEFGRFLTLDGFMMLTERDEFIYHEMITHVPMAANPDCERVLVIGAGDGGVVRELAKYSKIAHIDLVEIDKMVVDVSRKYLPNTADSLNDPRLTIHYQDGLRFVRGAKAEYDLIIVDSTDPFGPGEGLFTREFYGNCSKALRDCGILVNQHESPFYANDAKACQRAHRRIAASFPLSMVYQAHVPTYPSGHWLFGFASKGLHPIQNLDTNWNNLGLHTKYYNTDIHKGSFALPNYVRELLADD